MILQFHQLRNLCAIVHIQRTSKTLWRHRIYAPVRNEAIEIRWGSKRGYKGRIIKSFGKPCCLELLTKIIQFCLLVWSEVARMSKMSIHEMGHEKRRGR